MKERLLYIDKLKALAMLLVVWGHTMYFCMYHEQEGIKDPVLSIICSFHVPLFFFLSGFVISHAPDIQKFALKARKFLLPMLVVGFLNALLFGGVRDFFLNGGHFGYWYLLTLTIFYLMLVPFRITEGKRDFKTVMIDGAIALGLWAILIYSMKPVHVIITALNPWAIFSYWPFFIIGYLSRKYSIDRFITGKQWIAFALALAYIALIVASFSHIDRLPIILDFFIALVAIAALVALFSLFGDRRTFFDRQLLLIGKSTLNIYIYHYFFIRLINLDFLVEQSIPVEIAVTATLTIVIVYASIIVGKIIKVIFPQW